MSYAKDNISKGERIIYTTSLHWTIFLESVGILLLGILISFLGAYMSESNKNLADIGNIIGYLSLGVLGFGGVKFLLELIRHRSSEFVVTTQRIMIKVGVLQRKSLSMPLSKIESIEVDQSLIGRVLGFGSVQITGTGTAESKFDLITNPAKFRRKMQMVSGGNVNATTVEDKYQEKLKQIRRRRRRRRR